MKAKKLLVGTLVAMMSFTTIYAAPIAKNPNFKPVTAKEETIKARKVTADEATDLVNRVVPRGSTHIKTELDENKTCYEVTFNYKNMELEGLVEIATGQILSIEAEDTTFVGLKVVNLFYKNPAYKPAVTAYKAEQQALTLLTDGKILEKTELGEYNLLWAYRVVIGNKETEMEVILDTETNAIKYIKAYPALKEDMKFIGEEKVKAIIKEQVPYGNITSLKLDRQERVYNVAVVDPTHELTFKIDALTGKILDYTKTPITTKPEEGKLLTEQQVVDIIRSHSEYKKVAILKIELEKDDNKFYYEVKGVDGKFEYDFEIDAYTGKILDVDKEKMDDYDKPEANKMLTKEQVMDIIKKQSQYKHITIIDIELDHDDDDDAVYEVKGVDGKFEYDFEVDAYTGKILDVDKEKMDDDDDDYKGSGNKYGHQNNHKNHDDDDEWDD